MLFEIENIVQSEEQFQRRCFEDDYFELTVWYKEESIFGFQLTYERFGNERVLTWKDGAGFDHEKTDDSRTGMSIPASTILVPDGIFPNEYILNRFKEDSKNIDSDIVDFVVEKIDRYNV